MRKVQPGTDVPKVSERSAVEETLRRLGWANCILYQSQYDLISVYDTDYNILRISKAAEKIFGEVVGEKCYRAFHKRDAVCPDCPTARLLATGEITFLSERAVNNRTFSVTSFPLSDEQGNIVAVVEHCNDVTERRQAENDVRQKTAFWNTVFNSVNDLIAVIDVTDFTIVEANDAFLKAYGLSKEETIGKTCYGITHHRSSPCTGPDDTCPLTQLLSGAQHSLAEHVHYDAAGKEIITEVSASPIRNQRGEIVQIVHIARDITSRKRMEEELEKHRHHLESLVAKRGAELVKINERLRREVAERSKVEEEERRSKERFRVMVETISDWVWEVDANATYTYVSPKVTELLGYSPDEVLGKRPFDFMLPDEARRVEIEFASIANRHQPFRALENTNIHKDGRLVVLETSGAPIFDSRGIFCGYRGIDRDITERKYAQEVLKQSQEKLNLMWQAIGEGVVVTDLDGNIMEVNEAAIRLYECRDRGELVGRSAFDRIAPGDRHKARECMARTLREGQGILELTLLTANGREVAGEAHGALLKSVKGIPLGFIAVVRDITERKAVDALKDEFISLVSHEIRTPVTVIMGALNVALSEENISQEERRQLLLDAAGETESLSHVLTNLLELSRAQASRLFLYQQPTSVTDLVNGVIEKTRKLFPNHHFIPVVPKKTVMVDADPIRIELVLKNLLNNAAKYSPAGSEVRVLVKRGRRQVTLGVEDRGAGISPADQVKLFNPFERLGRTQLDAIKGTGIGLLVCLRLVEAHKGHIWVESEPGKGSSFFFSLPC